MINEFRKSINSILYERMTGPFFGAFAFSWLLWNWDTIYFILLDADTIPIEDKIKYVKTQFLEYKYTLLFPSLSTISILTIYPFLSNGSYWLRLRFDNWKYKQKNEIQDRQVITLEKSYELRKELKEHEEKFEKILLDKDEIIEQQKKQIEHLIKINSDSDHLIKEMSQSINDTQLFEPAIDSDLYKRLRDNKSFPELLKKLYTVFKEEDLVQEHWFKSAKISNDEKIYLKANNIIKENSKVQGLSSSIEFTLTGDGRNILNRYINERFS